MGCGASKKGGKQREIAEQNASAIPFNPPPPAIIPSGLKFTWLKDNPTGSCKLTLYTLSARFESNMGPVVQVGLGQYSTGTLSWKPAGTDDDSSNTYDAIHDDHHQNDDMGDNNACKDDHNDAHDKYDSSKDAKNDGKNNSSNSNPSPQSGYTDFTYNDVRFFTTADDSPRPEQDEQFRGFSQRWRVKTSTGEFHSVLGIDEQIQFAVSLVLKAQGITRGKIKDVIDTYLDSMKDTTRAKVEGETKSMSDSISGAWVGPQQYPPESMEYAGVDCVTMRRVFEADPNALTKETRETMREAIGSIAAADDDIDEDEFLRMFNSDVSHQSVQWRQEDKVILDASTMRPYAWQFEKRTSAEFSVRGEPHSSTTLLLKYTLITWDDNENLNEVHRHAEYADFSQACALRFESMQNEHVGLTRQAELAIKDTFDHVDRNGNGTIDSSELSAVIERISRRPPSDQEVAEAMAQLDKNSDGVIQWGEFRQYVVRQIASPGAGFKVNLVALVGDDVRISGDLFYAKGDGSGKSAPKFAHFRLNRSAATLERFASVVSGRPLERINLLHFDSASAVVADAETDAEASRMQLFPIELVSERRRITLYASTEEVRHKWVGALKRAIDTASGQSNVMVKGAVERLKNSMIKTVGDAVGMVCATTAPKSTQQQHQQVAEVGRAKESKAKI